MPFGKTKIGQLALYYFASTFWNKTQGILRHINNLNISKQNLKKYFISELKNSNKPFQI